MNLSGKHTANAPIEKIWELLHDPITLAKITPAVTRLEKTGESIYKAIADVSIGPVKGSFEGEMEVAEPNFPENFILKVRQNSTIGNVNAEVHMVLEKLAENQTQISFKGKARLSGLLARTGQRVMSGVANFLTKKFFKGLDEEVKTLS